jgi:hypothetical protein
MSDVLYRTLLNPNDARAYNALAPLALYKEDSARRVSIIMKWLAAFFMWQQLPISVFVYGMSVLGTDYSCSLVNSSVVGIRTADDFVVAQYQPNGVLASCPIRQMCGNWRVGKSYINMGGSDQPYAIAPRGDNQLVVAVYSDRYIAAAQLNTTDLNQPAIPGS